MLRELIRDFLNETNGKHSRVLRVRLQSALNPVIVVRLLIGYYDYVADLEAELVLPIGLAVVQGSHSLHDETVAPAVCLLTVVLLVEIVVAFREQVLTYAVPRNVIRLPQLDASARGRSVRVHAALARAQIGRVAVYPLLPRVRGRQVRAR